VGSYSGFCDREGLLQAQARNAWVVDSREAGRYQGLEEPIDPVAGHIPGAVNRPWQGVTDDTGTVCSEAELRTHWGDALQAQELLVYCGSGVTACVNLWSLSMLGREDAQLYAGSWSDWCSYL
jgi:thiosulfate/3-mercaptopyruvate sulfurtransferase